MAIRSVTSSTLCHSHNFRFDGLPSCIPIWCSRQSNSCSHPVRAFTGIPSRSRHHSRYSSLSSLQFYCMQCGIKPLSLLSALLPTRPYPIPFLFLTTATTTLIRHSSSKTVSILNDEARNAEVPWRYAKAHCQNLSHPLRSVVLACRQLLLRPVIMTSMCASPLAVQWGFSMEEN